jgi:hypothetical protein
VSATRTATLRADVSQDREKPKSGLSVTTLMIASLSSLAAALVVSRLWGGGTLIGAAMTPVIVALVSEGLNRPAKVIGTVPAKAIGTVRQTRGGRYDPVAEGRAGLREGDYERARASAPAAAVAERRVHRASGRGTSGGTGGAGGGGGGGFSLRLPRPRVIAAIATGLVAFVVAGVFLTGSELVLGKSVTSSSKRTTFVPVKRSTSSTDTKKDKTDTTKSDTTPTTTTTTSTPSTSTPAPEQTTPTVPPAQQTAPAVPPTTTAPPSAAPTPTPTAPATPAPQSATPPTTP